jgi:drug/metabolite transporter (DMT)-like permease
MSVGWLLVVQFAVAAAALLAAQQLRRGHRFATRGRRSPSSVGVAGVVGVVGLTGTIILQYVAFATAPLVAANVLSYAWPLLAALWVALTLRTRQALWLAGLALVGFGGVAVIFADPGAAEPRAAVAEAAWGYIAALGSAACMALYTLASSRLRVAATDLLVPATLAGVVAASALTVATDHRWPQTSGWIAAAYIGLGPMAAGYTLWTLAMAAGGAERLAPLGYATPLLSTVLLIATGLPATTTTLLGITLVLVCSIGVLAVPRVRPDGCDAHRRENRGPDAPRDSPSRTATRSRSAA